MWHYALKVVLTTAVIIAVSEVAKRSTFWAAVLASLPLTSLLALIWLYVETGDMQKVATLSQDIFWLVIPSLLLFVLLPLLLGAGWGFWASLSTSSVAAAAAYFGMAWILGRLHINA